MAPYIALSMAAATAYDAKLFEPEEEAPALARLPMVSLIAIALLIAIPAIDEISRRTLSVSPATESLRVIERFTRPTIGRMNIAVTNGELGTHLHEALPVHVDRT